MTQPIPPTSARVERIAAELREQSDNLYAYAIGRIDGFARYTGYADLTDTEARAAIRDVLAALDLVLAEVRAELRDGGQR